MSKRKIAIQIIVCCAVLALFVGLANRGKIKDWIDWMKQPKTTSAPQSIHVNSNGGSQETTGDEIRETTGDEIRETTEADHTQDEVHLTISTKWGLLKEGELHYTLSNVRLVCHEDDIPRAEGFQEDAACIFPGLAANPFEDASVHYPDFITEDGSFIPGAYLLLVDITVTSNGAKAYTIYDLDEGGYPKGQLEEDNLFHADGMLGLMSTPGYIAGETLFYGIDYFSERGKLEEDPLIYRLDPGQSTTFTLGFLVDDEAYGGRFHIEDLAFCNIMGDLPDAVYIRLDLKGN